MKSGLLRTHRCRRLLAQDRPYKSSHHPAYSALPKVAEDAVLAAGVRLSDPSQEFIDPAQDKTSEGEKVRV
ncbi:MAG: hypothetical protein WA510_22540 [Acidobacteriaceae bacterium]